MYAKCNALLNAQEVFADLSFTNIGSWNGLIAGYAQYGYGEETLHSYKRMLCEGLLADSATFASIFKACGDIGVASKGQEIHAQIAGDRLLKKDIILCTALLDMYAKCGLFEKAEDVFDRLLVQDVVSWNALLAGYVQHEQGEEALKCFEQMQWEGLCPDAVTFLGILKACGGSTGAAFKGQEIHAEIVRAGLLKTDVLLGNTLVDMYTKCGLIGKAEEVFEELPVRSFVSWNVLISGYAQHGLGVEALICFECLQHEGHAPDRVTFLSMLKACGSIGSTSTCNGQEIHSTIVKVGLPETDFVVGTALVDMYAKCGMLDEAQTLFDELQNRDVVSWNALVNGYVQHMHGEEALKHFEWMQLEGFSPDSVTFVCILKACGIVGVADEGQELHEAIVREGLLEIDTVVGNAVVDMYANCGMLAEAQDVFDNLPDQDVVSWNAVISGYAQLGEVQIVFEFLDKMKEGDQVPDLITFTLVLNTCSHSGLVEEGQMYFEMMGTGYGLMPDLEHYSCMVDLFSRAGQIDNAVEDVGAYICLSNIYAGRSK